MALARQGETALRFYLTEVHELGAELSISATLAPVTPALQALAERSPDRSAHREDEPYRRALIGIYARLAATLHALTGTEALRHAVAPQRPVRRRATSCCADLRVIEASLRRHHAAGAGRAAPGAADARGAGVRLPPRHASTCARAPTSTRRWSPSCCAVARIEADYAALDRSRAARAAAARCSTTRGRCACAARALLAS